MTDLDFKGALNDVLSCQPHDDVDKAIIAALRIADEISDDWVLKDNEYTPTSNREVDLANYGWNQCIKQIRKAMAQQLIREETEGE